MENTENPSDEAIPLVDEHVLVGKRRVETGRVRVRVVTDTETVNVNATVSDQNVEVKRVPIGREVTEVPTVRQENGVTIVPVLEEVLVVEKRLVLIEEVHIRQVVTQTEVSHPMAVRRQRAEVERTDAGSPETAKE
jgi:stress response protein YsnF